MMEGIWFREVNKRRFPFQGELAILRAYCPPRLQTYQTTFFFKHPPNIPPSKYGLLESIFSISPSFSTIPPFCPSTRQLLDCSSPCSIRALFLNFLFHSGVFCFRLCSGSCVHKNIETTIDVIVTATWILFYHSQMSIPMPCNRTQPLMWTLYFPLVVGTWLPGRVKGRKWGGS